MAEDGRVENDAYAASVQNLVQAGVIHGDFHLHSAEPLVDTPVGVPLGKLSDPFDMEVHRPIILESADELPVLPRYVSRAHDERLACAVDLVRQGRSAMAVLVAGSSAGKTRACWEALKPLRGAGGWRLWHPLDPTRPEAALQGLDRVKPYTVVWLNETQEYLTGDSAERVAAKLRSLLADMSRAPVLILGTLWPEHHDALTRRSGSQTQQMLDGAVISVPGSFTGTDFSALADAATHDPRLASAIKHAADGEITQYLAGAPALLDRFHTAPAAAKALILAAMDARRMGHRDTLPLPLLEHAAPAYMTEAQWQALSENWLAEALAYLAQPCKGALGPITLIKPGRSTHRRERPAQAAYKLADYLEQWGRAHRATEIPPIGFWAAAARHAHPDDLIDLGRQAFSRGLSRDAIQLFKSAYTHGKCHVSEYWDDIVRHLYILHPADIRPARWVADHLPLHNPRDLAVLLNTLASIEAKDQFTALLDRIALTDIELTRPADVIRLLNTLHNYGRSEEKAERFAHHVAANIPLGKPWDIAELLEVLHDVGATGPLSVLLARDPAAHVSPIADADAHAIGLEHVHAQYWSVTRLLRQLQECGADDQVTTLADRVSTGIDLRLPTSVAVLMKALNDLGAAEQVIRLAGYAASHAPLSSPRNPSGPQTLLLCMHEVGATEQRDRLADRAVADVPLDDDQELARLLGALRYVKSTQHLVRLADRAIGHADLASFPGTITILLKMLPSALEAVSRLADRAAAECALDDPGDLADLLKALKALEATEQITLLLARDPAAHTSVRRPYWVAKLLNALHEVGAEEQMVRLADRAANDAPLSNPLDVTELLGTLRKVGALNQTSVLLSRDPATQVDLARIYRASDFLFALAEIGATEQLTRLADRVVHAPLDDPHETAALLGALHELVTTDHVALLAGRAAARTPLVTRSGRSWEVVKLLRTLHQFGTADHVRTLADRVVHSPVVRKWSLDNLLEALNEVGLDDHAAQLIQQLPARGEFHDFMKIGDHWTRFRFGREPDGTPAAPWGWDDLY